MQPAARFASEAEARDFFDSAVSSYMESVGIDPLQMPTVTGPTTQDLALEPVVLDRLRQDQDALNRRLMSVYAGHLHTDLDTTRGSNENLMESVELLQSQLGLWVEEHGKRYGDGITSMFDAEKARHYDSSWNWGMQALLSSFYAIINGTLDLENRGAVAKRAFRIRNQCNERLVEAMRHLRKVARQRGQAQHRHKEQYNTAARFLGNLIDTCVKDLQLSPVARGVSNITAPKTLIDTQGNIQYLEVPRFSERGSSSDCKSIEELSVSQADVDEEWPKFLEYASVSHSHVRIKRKGKDGWVVSDELTQKYWDCLDLGITHGITFHEKCILITGASKRSIGLNILKAVLSGGAKVVVTTSSYSAATARFYQELYAEYGARGSRLVVVPFNQGSKRDIESLVSYIYEASVGLGWDLDYIVPFAAISEKGRDISNIDSLSELAHRVMLTNIVRMLGEVKTQKSVRGIITRPAQVILPLSPNHGIFGSDGLYSESKLALQALLNKWRSEDWGDCISICGTSIGWTRGTGLMSANDIVAEGIERLGIRTFSQEEMASNILGLMSPTITSACQVEPIIADLMGGMDAVDDFDTAVSVIRENVNTTSEIRRAILLEEKSDYQAAHGRRRSFTSNPYPTQLERRMNISLGFPKILQYEAEIAPFHGELAGMVDLERVVVVVGFSEIGPYGSSRTRWEIEAKGELSFEGCIEMAWMMGLIKHHNGPIAGQGNYNGWVDAKTRDPIADQDIKARYQAHILGHTGIRQVELNSEGSSDATKKPYLHELIVGEDLEPFEVPRETATYFKMYHGNKVEIVGVGESGQFRVQIKKGATLLLPKATDIGRRVAGQVPTGWDARTYGISDDIISQVDKLTLYSLVCTVEALLCAGVTDPYEFYQHIHTSDIGICIGSSLGGLSSLNVMFKHRLVDKQVQSDVLQETYINTTSAWINMLLLSANGPIRTPVGACATALEALDTGYELIVGGKAKMCLVGGLDDLQDDMSFEFANMKATIDPETDFKRGREPGEMSRPATTSRDGFVEAHGCGLQVLTSAKLALEMGLPIHCVVALTHTASDKIGRSIPAPGRGLLAVAREASSALRSPLLDIRYRKQLLDNRLTQIQQEEEFKFALFRQQPAKCSHEIPPDVAAEYSRERISCIQAEAEVQEKEALYTYGNHFWKGDSRISPLRAALATWGLTIDDLDIASFHGTSTAIGDKNEMEVIQRQLSHLGRTKGNPVIGVFQKHLTGHSKGAAGAWMLNGCLQVLNHGLVPGNRNADNIDKDFEKLDHITFPNTSIQTDGVKAFSITSFGFGQKGAQAIGVHPKYLFATLDKDTYCEYQNRVLDRTNRARAHFQSGMINSQLFVPKDHPPYSDDREEDTFLDPMARFA
jgi:fatty acid synthase subunit alpha